jgi:hypothetical protein
VLTALAKDPAQRYQSAVELQDALEQVLAGNAVAAGPGSPAAVAVATEPLPGRPGGRTGVLPAAAGPAVRDSGQRLAHPLRPPRDPPRQRHRRPVWRRHWPT